MSYYARTHQITPEGLRVFSTPDDRASEDRVAAELSKAWGVRLNRFAQFDPIDWWVEKGGMTVGYVELKTRSVTASTYATVFLSLHKYFHLLDKATRSDIYSVFVVAFTDSIRWIDVRDVDARRPRLAGLARRVKSRFDREPVIDVPIAAMSELSSRKEGSDADE